MDGMAKGYDVPDEYAIPYGAACGTKLRANLDARRFTQHGFIGGATGTGKTRGMQAIIEFLSQRGVPTLLSDAKGDCSGLAVEGVLSPKMRERAHRLGQEWWDGTNVPVEFLALGGHGLGTAVRVSARTFPYASLAKLIGLTPAQTTGLGYAFLASDNLSGGAMDTLEEVIEFLRGQMDDPDSALTEGVGNRIISQINLFQRDNDGLFGAPDFDPMDLIQRAGDGWGMVNIINSSELDDSPEVLTTFMLWVLDQLAKKLPESTSDLPRLVVFLDEAHLLFDGATKEFIQGVIRTVKKIRSKGVGVFFVSQSAADIPPKVLAQVGNRIQHALRANSYELQRDITRTARTFPLTTQFPTVAHVEDALTSMGTGEAIISTLQEDGHMAPTTRVEVFTPRSSMAPIDDEQVEALIAESDLHAKYRRMEAEHARKAQRASTPPPLHVPSRPSQAAGDRPERPGHRNPVEAMRDALRGVSGGGAVIDGADLGPWIPSANGK